MRSQPSRYTQPNRHAQPSRRATPPAGRFRRKRNDARPRSANRAFRCSGGLEASGAWRSKLCQCLEQRGSCRMILRLRALRINDYRGRHACRELHMGELLAHFIRQRLGRGAGGALRARARRTTAALLLIPTRSFFAQRANGKAHEGHDDCKSNGGGKIHGKHGTSSVRLRMLRGMRDILFNPNGFSRPEQTGASKMPVRRERSSREQMPASSAQETHAARGPPSKRAPVANLYAASAAPATAPGFSLPYLGMGRNSWNRMAASTTKANTVPMPNPPPASSVPNW